MEIPSLDPPTVPLVLGGHSFIHQVGNDPPATEEEQLRIVASCLDQGICWFDTTYQPERVALGKILDRLGRRAEATILAWNFFTDFRSDEDVGTAREYQREDIERILEQLHTSYVDGLVLCLIDDPDRRRRQEELLTGWQKKGYVRALGLWVPNAETIRHYRETNAYRFAVRPFNVKTEEDSPAFSACRIPGREVFATSPFFRGWELDRLVKVGAENGLGEVGELRGKLADLMLRFSLFESGADRVIIAMRRVEWVQRNIASIARGPLGVEEQAWLGRVKGLGAPKVWWRRVADALSG